MKKIYKEKIEELEKETKCLKADLNKKINKYIVIVLGIIILIPIVIYVIDKLLK